MPAAAGGDAVYLQTSTTGTGPVEVAAVAGGWKGLQEAFPLDGTLVQYAILNSSLVPIEWGYGTTDYGGAENQLQRTEVVEPSGGAFELAGNNYVIVTQLGEQLDGMNWQDVASAGTTDIGNVKSPFVNLTGSATITSLGTPKAGFPLVWLKVAGDSASPQGFPTLTHNATSLILPGGANIATALGDVIAMKHEGSGNWRCVGYLPAATAPGGGGLTQDWAALASAATADLGSANSTFVNITGTVGISAFGTPSGNPLIWVRFDGALTLTHHATSLILPTGSNISTLSGDVAAFKHEGSGNWRCVQAPQRWFANLPAAVTASGTAVDFTVPAGVTHIRLVIRSLSTNGTSQLNVQLGDSGGVETTAYSGGTTTNGTFGNANVGFPLSNGNNAAAYAWSGLIDLQARNRDGGEWVVNGAVSVASNVGSTMSGSKDLNSRLETVRIAPANGTDTFDLGEIAAWFYFD